MSSSLGPYEEVYDAVQSASDIHSDDLHLVASYPYHLPYWLEPSLPTLDYLSKNFPSDESMMEIMSAEKYIWEDHHHQSYFLPNANLLDFDLVSLISIDIVTNPQTPVLLQDTNSEENICNITNTTPIDISVMPRTVEHIHVGQNCSTK